MTALANAAAGLGTLVGYIKNAAFEPVLTGPLLYVLTRGPEPYRQRVRDVLLRPFSSADYSTNLVRAGYLINALKWFFALGLASRVNRVLSAWAANHWRWTKQGVAWDFDEKTKKEIAIVTGGCSGFGLLISKGLAERCKVVVMDVQDLPEDLKSSSISFYKCDITSAPAVKETADAIRKDIGVPTILINNAGIATGHTILDTSPEWLEKIFRVNLLSHWTLIKEFLPAMLEQKKGHILALASMASYFTPASLTDYCATKAGVLSLHEGLNQELRFRYGPNGRCIQTSIVHPMWAQTPLVKDWESSLVASKTTMLPPKVVADKVVAQIFSGRSGQIYVPDGMSMYSAIKGFPTWLQEHARDGLDGSTKPT